VTVPQDGPGADDVDPRRWRALAVTLTAGFMSLLDVSIVNVALPSIQSGLHASPQGVQWVVSGYALTFGLTLVAGGRFGDVLGRRRMFLIALSAFIVTSAAAGLAPNEFALIGARLVQGVAAGLLTPQNTGLIQQMFRGAERGRAFGLFGSTVGVSTAAGPVIGGLILAAFGDQDGWRWVFFVNVPIGLVALVFAARLVPGRPNRERQLRGSIDYRGIALLAATVLCVLLPLVQSEGGGVPWLWLLTPFVVLFGWLFVRSQRRRRRGSDRPPLLDLRLFTRTPGYPPGIVLGTVYFCGFSGIWLVFSLFLQDGLGYPPLQSGLAVTPFAIGSAATAVIAGRLVERWQRRLTVAGLSMVTVGLAAAAVLIFLVRTPHIGLVVAAPLLLAGIGGGAVISPNTTLTLECVPTEMAGAAGGALQTGQRIGTAIGTAVLTTVFRLVIGDGRDYPRGAAVAIATAVAFTLVALTIAVLELRARRRRARTAEADSLAAAD
jgi:EmrB/QacA subfamily drug resistance transporter